MAKKDNLEKGPRVLFIGSQEGGSKVLKILVKADIKIIGCFSLKPAKHETWIDDLKPIP